MKNKPNAYEHDAQPDLNRVWKCSKCFFKCVFAQLDDNEGKCPRCQEKDTKRGVKTWGQ